MEMFDSSLCLSREQVASDVGLAISCLFNELTDYFAGSGERVEPDGNIYYGLVLSYCPKGRLSTYLTENTLNWSTFCSIVLSATRGLAHLHSEIRKGGTLKTFMNTFYFMFYYGMHGHVCLAYHPKFLF